MEIASLRILQRTSIAMVILQLFLLLRKCMQEHCVYVKRRAMLITARICPLHTRQSIVFVLCFSIRSQEESFIRPQFEHVLVI